MGIVYLLHFDQRLGRRRHYLGYTSKLEQRLEDHRLGRGGKTTATFRKAGIGFELAAQWPGSPEDERRFKAKNLASLCPICKEEKMTVLEALQQSADVGTRKASMSLTDLVKVTKASRSRVRQDLKDLLDEGKVTIVSKGDAGQNKTVYQLALCVPARPAVRENYAQHSFVQPNRTVEQDATRVTDSIAVDTVRAHRAASTVSNSSTGDGIGASAHAEPTTGTAQVLAPKPLDPRTSALPPSLAYFKDLRRLGCCLDVTCHYIVNVRFALHALRFPYFAGKIRPSGTLRVLHIPYADSRIQDVFHGVFYFADSSRCAGTPCTCGDHELMRLVRDGFPTALETHAQVHTWQEYLEALYDVRRFCPECAGVPVLPARFPGFDYIPYELTAGRTGTADQEEVAHLQGGNPK